MLAEQLNKADQAKMLDGVYIDTAPGAGVAGTDWPIGTPWLPGSNLADALIMMANRGLHKLYLVGVGVHAITLTNGFDAEIAGSSAYTITIQAGAIVVIESNLSCVELVNTTGQVTIMQDFYASFRLGNTTGAVGIEGNCQVDGSILNTGALGTIRVGGFCQASGLVQNTNTGSITINGSMTSGAITNSGGGDITVLGVLAAFSIDNTGGDDFTVALDCICSGTMVNTAGDIIINGNCYVGGDMNNTTGTITTGNCTVVGDIENTGMGTIRVNGTCQVDTGHMTNSGAGDIRVRGNCYVNGEPGAAEGWINNTGGNEIYITGHVRCNYIANTTGTVYIFGDCQTYGSFTTTTGDCIIGGNGHISGDLTTTSGDITVYGNLFVRGVTTVTLNGGLVRVYGNAEIVGVVTTSIAGAVVNISGVAHLWSAPATTGTLTINARNVFSMDFWSFPQEEVQAVGGGGGTVNLPDVVVAGIPAGARIVIARAIFKFRIVENTNAGANALNGDQHIQIQKGGGGGYVDAISLIDNMFTFTAAGREGGDAIIGDHDATAKVDADATYNFQWLTARADNNNLQFNDCQVGLRIWYSV